MKRVQRNGSEATAKHVKDLIEAGNYPVYYIERFIKYLLEQDDFAVAGQLLQATEKYGIEHCLIDKLGCSHLWAIGKQEEAISLAIKSADKWLAPFLYLQVSGFYSIKGNREKSDHYFNIAHSLAMQEEFLSKQKS